MEIKRKWNLRGSLTVETILVLPLCLMVLVIFMTFFQVLRMEIQLQNALEQTLQHQALLIGTKKEAEVSYIEAEGEFLLLCQTEGVDFDRIEWGAAGLHLLLSVEDKTVLQGTLLYRVRLPFLSSLRGQLFCVQHGHCRIWSGSSYTKETTSAEYGYYTEYGTVYHIYLDCTYLKLSIRQVTEEELPSVRNRSGGRYYPCELCGEKTAQSGYYITEQGDRYHTSLSCSALTRYIKTVPIDQASELGLHVCSRCEKRINQNS